MRIELTQVMIVLFEISRMTWIVLHRIQLISKFCRVDYFPAGVFQLIVNVRVTFFGVCGVHASIAHRADRLAEAHQITYLHILSMSMKDLMRKAVRILDGNSPYTARSGICTTPDTGDRNVG
jgi:hypothetical protein